MKTSRFALHAAELSQRMFLGRLIKFDHGAWKGGPDKAPISAGETFVAVMNTLTIGFIKWVDGKQVDSQMGLVADGFRMPQRRDLDDYDSKNWRVDENGDLIDPWSPTTLLVLVSADEPHGLHTFSTSTDGGKGAIGDLCEMHARSTEDAGQYPVVTLGSGSYEHRIKSRGSIKTPVFKVVDAVDAAPFDAMVAGARGGAGFTPTLPASERRAISGPRRLPRRWPSSTKAPTTGPMTSATTARSEALGRLKTVADPAGTIRQGPRFQ